MKHLNIFDRSAVFTDIFNVWLIGKMVIRPDMKGWHTINGFGNFAANVHSTNTIKFMWIVRSAVYSLMI